MDGVATGSVSEQTDGKTHQHSRRSRFHQTSHKGCFSTHLHLSQETHNWWSSVIHPKKETLSCCYQLIFGARRVFEPLVIFCLFWAGSDRLKWVGEAFVPVWQVQIDLKLFHYEKQMCNVRKPRQRLNNPDNRGAVLCKSQRYAHMVRATINWQFLYNDHIFGLRYLWQLF